uniref:HAT C-terminal dimerisation domain-containing protein n=1 Tax=Physcomitrium patens TaxID=3218 RepID=A0A2K1IWQ1_PHYPA|nr:hypothetical protein PHYPA_023519 [Physcomitrium patens]
MFADLVQKAKEVALYVRNHHVSMALFRRYSPKLSLSWPAVTRFACNNLMIHRLLKVKNALEMVVIDPAWIEYVSSLFNRQNGPRAHAKASQTPAMGVAWLTMNKLKKHVFGPRNEPFNMPPEIVDRLESSFLARWKKMTTDLHYAGALLNPYLANNKEIQNDESRGPYSPLEAGEICNSNLLPHQWWNRVGGQSLPQIAKRILAQTCSASSCERNWNMYSFEHSKSGNRLGVKKAEDLVYIYTHSRLLRGPAGPDPIRWYDENVHSVESDPDGSLPSNTEDEGLDSNNEGYNWLGGDWENLAGNNNPTSPANRPVRDNLANNEDNGGAPDDHFHNVYGDPVDPFVFNEVDTKPIPSAMELSNDNHAQEAESNVDGLALRGIIDHNDNIPEDPFVDSEDSRGNGPLLDGHGIGIAERDASPKDGNAVNNIGNNNKSVEPVATTESIKVLRNIESELQTTEPDMEEDVRIQTLFRRPPGHSTSLVGRTLLNLKKKSPSTSFLPPLHRSACGLSGVVDRVILAPQLPSARVGSSTMGSRSGTHGGRSNAPLPFFTGPWQSEILERVIGAKGNRFKNMDGVTDKRKNARVKRLVNTASSAGADLQVRNLNSEIEEYVAPTSKIPAETFSSSGDDADDEDCDEVPGDNTVVLHGVPTPQNRRRSN